MSDTIIMIGEDGKADLYDDTYDITIHCETKEDCDQAMRMLKSMQWIPCSERLPEESGLYIVTNVGRWVEPVGTRYYNIRADGSFWSGLPGNTVVAWMPLPEPYKEGHDERE